MLTQLAVFPHILIGEKLNVLGLGLVLVFIPQTKNTMPTIGWQSTGYGLAMGVLWVCYGLAVDWLCTGYGLAISYPSPGYGLDIGWLSAGYQLIIG